MLVLAFVICLIKAFNCECTNDSFNQSSKTVFDLQAGAPPAERQCNQNESSGVQDFNQFVEDIIYIKKDRFVNDASDFCLRDLNSKNYRTYRKDFKCELKASISNVFQSIKIYNITLMLFYDRFFEKKSHNVTTDLKYLIKGLQESYTTFDVINEIGLIKFYVDAVRQLNLRMNDVIDTNQLQETFVKYMQSQEFTISSKVINIWFTRANLVAYEREKNGKISIKRIEGVANCDSFCDTGHQLILVNCNSLNKAVITLSHEIAHILGSEHDENYENACPHDSVSFLMSRIYSPERNVLSAVAREKIQNTLTTVKPHCLARSAKYQFGYEELKGLEVLSLDEQCKFSYSNRFVSDQPPFDSPTFCEHLHCRLGLLKLFDFRVMNGTPCNRRPTMVCCFGRCLVNCTIFDHK